LLLEAPRNEENPEGAKATGANTSANLVAMLGDTPGAMSAMLNTLLDVNQIEAGVVRAEVADYNIGDLLHRMRDEYAYHAQAQGLVWRVVPCSLVVRSDPRLIEQMIRNLLSNALKYTKRGKVLLGCRRHGDVLRIEIWDTGVGIPAGELNAIFEEYHQVDNAARERSRALALAYPSCSGWETCWVIGCASAPARAAARSSLLMSRAHQATRLISLSTPSKALATRRPKLLATAGRSWS